MFEAITDIFDVPAAEGTIVTIEDASITQRTFAFHNRGPNTITMKFQTTDDGGTVWTDYGVSFTVGPEGGGAEMVVKNITVAKPLRIRGSGGTADRDLALAMNRELAGSYVRWRLPV